ncbi:hypothetical protein [Paenibacillus cremeus]|uniref:Homing endonuclease LAGLIDADG domain-containing protein n=1 Tax=Paenibacillus cremeus TaxID=2163881 RepID=A0A559KCG8_9BACL|nr:hypothetical protein [Paenibacillus cremeus]TVY09821.1 hypothetical protein FPZ49_10625 [Paenibacillus cremeus]
MATKSNASYTNEIYHDYNWCYQKFVIEGLNHQEMAKEANTTVRTIKKWVVEKHRLTGNIRKEVKKLSSRQEDLIVGSILGDGHITNEKYIPLFIVSHAKDERDYLYWKYEILKDICNTSPRLIKSTEKPFGDKVYISQDAFRFNTRSLDDLKRFRDMPICDVMDRLNEFSFSIWMLDDASRSPTYWELCVAPYNEIEVDKMLDIIHRNFNLDCKLQTSDKRYIRFTAKASRDVDTIILKNIPNGLDVVKKKITENEISEEAIYFWVSYNNEKIGLRRFCDENELPYLLARDYYHNGIIDGDMLIDYLGKNKNNK